MEKLTLVEVAPRWEGDAAAMLGWPDESWDEYATACVEHVDLHPARPKNSETGRNQVFCLVSRENWPVTRIGTRS